jgi:hypothetical protein
LCFLGFLLMSSLQPLLAGVNLLYATIGVGANVETF